MNAPRKLSMVLASPSYDSEAIKHVDIVCVDGVSPGPCVAYDMDAGWANFKVDGHWTGKMKGEITVRMKP